MRGDVQWSVSGGARQRVISSAQTECGGSPARLRNMRFVTVAFRVLVRRAVGKLASNKRPDDSSDHADYRYDNLRFP
jgi:hypothetical protein